MSRKRVIRPDEASTWLGILLSAAFDSTNMTHNLNLAKSAEILNANARRQGLPTVHSPESGKCQLLDLAYNFTNNPRENPPKKLAEQLLQWSYQWLQPKDWLRLQERNKKRRNSSKIDHELPF